MSEGVGVGERGWEGTKPTFLNDFGRSIQRSRSFFAIGAFAFFALSFRQSAFARRNSISFVVRRGVLLLLTPGVSLPLSQLFQSQHVRWQRFSTAHVQIVISSAQGEDLSVDSAPLSEENHVRRLFI